MVKRAPVPPAAMRCTPGSSAAFVNRATAGADGRVDQVVTSPPYRLKAGGPDQPISPPQVLPPQLELPQAPPAQLHRRNALDMLQPRPLRWLISPAELSRFADCSLSLRLQAAADAGVSGAPEPTGEAPFPLDSAAAETRLQARLEQQYGPPLLCDRIPGRAHAWMRTRQALRGQGPRLLVQPSLPAAPFDVLGLRGRPDFLTRDGARRGEIPSWHIWDAKLGRAPGPGAVGQRKLARHSVQLGAYARILQRRGLAVSGATLVYDDHDLEVDLPTAQARVQELLHQAHSALGDPQQRPAVPSVDYDVRSAEVCAICPFQRHCTARLAEERDVQLLPGLRASQRDVLLRAGIKKVEQLASSSEPVPGFDPSMLAKHRAQAVRMSDAQRTGQHVAQVVDLQVVQNLPPADAADLYLDFEGHVFAGRSADGRSVPLEYLAGVLRADGQWMRWWAHDLTAQRHLFIEMLGALYDHLRQHPRAHVYHYAPYEGSALRRLHQQVVSETPQREGRLSLQRDRVLSRMIDLCAVVKHGLVTSLSGNGLKELEVFYRDTSRDGQVTTALGSVVAYDEYRRALVQEDQARAAAVLVDIERYNRDDCLSTQQLCMWLRALARGGGLQR